MNITDELIAEAVEQKACDDAIVWAREQPRTVAELIEYRLDWWMWAVWYGIVPAETYPGATLEGKHLTVPCAETGDIYVGTGATLTLPVCAKTGDIDVRAGATLTLPVCAETGYIYVGTGATLTLPVCAETGYIDVREGGNIIRT